MRIPELPEETLLLNAGQWFLAVMAAECALAVPAFLYSKNPGMAAAMAGYTIANLGLIYASR